MMLIMSLVRIVPTVSTVYDVSLLHVSCVSLIIQLLNRSSTVCLYRIKGNPRFFTRLIAAGREALAAATPPMFWNVTGSSPRWYTWIISLMTSCPSRVKRYSEFQVLTMLMMSLMHIVPMMVLKLLMIRAYHT